MADGDRIGGVLVTGATGMIGTLLVDALLDRGTPLTAMVRDGSGAARFAGRRGVQVVQGDFDDPATLEKALVGVDQAFLLTDSTDRTQAQQLAFVDAARTAGVRHLVKLSQLHATADSPVRFLRYHAAVEVAITQAGIPHTFVRPNLIMQAYLAYAPAVAAGVLQAPIGEEARVSIVDARDVAAVAAVALTEDGHDGCAYDITGPAALTHPEIAAAFAVAAGHEVRFTRVGEDEFVAAIEQAGMPAWQAHGLAEDYAHYDRGEAATVSPDVERVTGHPARSMAAFAAEHAAAFREQ